MGKIEALTEFLLIAALTACSRGPRYPTYQADASSSQPARSTEITPVPDPIVLTPEPTTSTEPNQHVESGPNINPPTLESRFIMEGIDLSNTIFSITASASLRELLGHVFATEKSYSADIPLPVKVPFFGTEEQLRVFDEAAKDNSNGNPFYVILTSESNHMFVYFHSLQQSAPGDLAREIGGFVHKNPEKVDELLKSKVNINFNGLEVEAEIVYVSTVSEDFFENFTSNSPWGVYPENANVLFARTDLFGIPNEIRTDASEGVFYLTIIGCQNQYPGDVSFDPRHPEKAYLQNTANRTLLTLKIAIK